MTHEFHYPYRGSPRDKPDEEKCGICFTVRLIKHAHQKYFSRFHAGLFCLESNTWCQRASEGRLQKACINILWHSHEIVTFWNICRTLYFERSHKCPILSTPRTFVCHQTDRGHKLNRDRAHVRANLREK